MRRKAAFIDRDGVLNEERGYVHRIEDFALIPGTLEALAALKGAGYALVVVTNQSGIARGLYGESDYQALAAHLRGRLRQEGIELDAMEYCPHLPDAPVSRYRLECECRKPKPGMLLRAIASLDIDPKTSFLVGDRSADIEAGRAAGIARCFLVRSGHALPAAALAGADGVFDDLLGCARYVLRRGNLPADMASSRPG